MYFDLKGNISMSHSLVNHKKLTVITLFLFRFGQRFQYRKQTQSSGFAKKVFL